MGRGAHFLILPAIALGTLALAQPASAQVVPAPSFEDVLKAPDDVAVNTAYARAQIAAGNMLYAAAAYERLLLERPDDDAIRLDYIAVLLDLDDAAGAHREIDKLGAVTLAPDQSTRLTMLKTRLAAATPETGQ